MSARGETLLWVAQRASAMVLALAVVVHIGTIIFAVQGGLSAAEILGRVRGNGAWLAFYAVFVAAAAVHAPIGLRNVLAEMTRLSRRAAGGVAVVVALVLAWTGWRAAFMLYGGA